MPTQEMVSAYDLIQQLKKQALFGPLVEAKIISPNYVQYTYVYESFLACQSQDKTKTSCYEETGKAVHLSADRVRKIVMLMSDPANWLSSQPKK